jgi:hypothetical protein
MNPLVELLRRGRPVRTVIRTRSMWPMIWPGDEVRVVPIDRIRVGDVVLAQINPERLVLHRVVEAVDGRVLTRADLSLAGDEPVAQDAVVGRLERIERRGRVMPIWGAWVGRLCTPVFRCVRPPIRRLRAALR